MAKCEFYGNKHCILMCVTSTAAPGMQCT